MRFRLVSLFVALILFVPSAWAENPKINVNLFRPSVHPGDLLGVQTSAMTAAWDFYGAGIFSYTQAPLRIVDNDGKNLFQNVDYQFMANLLLGINLFSWVDVGVDLPILMASSGQTPHQASGLEKVSHGAIGDFRLGLKGVILKPESFYGFGLGISEDISFPTATGRNLIGDDAFTFTTQLIADYYMKGWRGALNIGYRARTSNVDILPRTILPVGAVSPKTYDELVMGFGGQFPILCGILEALLTAEIRTKASSPFSAMDSTGFDLMAGAKYHYRFLSVLAAGGAGLMKAPGSPKMRFFVGVAYEPQSAGECCPDRDKDGVCDENDRCPDEPGPRKFQGCPDRDGDGIPDIDDRCPDEPGPAEFQGCPDTDGDGIPDIDDACVLLPGLAKFQGCPDTDGDGIPDHLDRCPKEKGLFEHDGCPDTDGDGIADHEDECPTVPGVRENRGCPSGRIEIVRDKLVLKDKVFFEDNRAEISSDSFGLLDEMASVLMAHPEVRRIRVEGHTDSRGRAAVNLRLSQERAEAVRAYLIRAGVHPGRMEAQGYGHKRPIAPNNTETGREANRRVEFTILERR